MKERDNAFSALMKERAEGKLEEMDQFVQLREILAPVYRPGMTILDVGCGMGHALRSLRMLDPEVRYRGLDLSEERLAEARRCFPGVEFTKGDVEELDGIEPADIVLCFMLLLHLEDCERALASLSRVARSRLVIRTLLAPEAYTIRRYRRDGKWFWYNMYDESRFVEILKARGFDEVAVHDSPLRREIPYENDWKTWTLGERQVFGQLILPWRVVHAGRRDAS